MKVMINNYISTVTIQCNNGTSQSMIYYQNPFYSLLPSCTNFTFSAGGYASQLYVINTTNISAFETFVNITMVPHYRVGLYLIDSNNNTLNTTNFNITVGTTTTLCLSGFCDFTVTANGLTATINYMTVVVATPVLSSVYSIQNGTHSLGMVNPTYLFALNVTCTNNTTYSFAGVNQVCNTL